MTTRYPQRPEAHQLEELSVRFFASKLPRNWRSEKPEGDYGVDLKVDIFEGSHATGLELLVQLKASSESKQQSYETIRMQVTTYNYLWDKLQVVMLVKYVEEDDEAYWILLNQVPSPKPNQRSLTARLPKVNCLSKIDWQEIQEYVREVTDDKLEARRHFRFRTQR